MTHDRLSNRRDFLGNLVKSAAGCAAIAWSERAAEAQIAPPRNVKMLPNTIVTPSTKPLIAMGDLGWLGMCHAPDAAFSYSQGTVAVRYVAGERRILMPKFHFKDATNGTTGSLAELRLPTLARTLDMAQAMTVVREWQNWNWVPTGDLLAQLANGWEIGGLWWDDMQQVVWYTIYPYYGPNAVPPFLGATRLNDNGTVTQYGPWYYISPTDQRFRKVSRWILPIPPSAQGDCGGRRVAIGAAYIGASGGMPVNWGPGLTALRLPDLGSTAPVEAGVPLMDYSPGAGGLDHPWCHCRREADYRTLNSSGGAIPAPVGGEGFWQASADNATGVAWIETNTRHGLILLGQRTSHVNWYGFADSYNTTVDGVTVRLPLPTGVDIDTMMPSQGSTGYHSDGWQSAFWRFDPAQIREVARGQRKASADGMRPALLGQWNLQWPNIPRPIKFPYVYPGFGTAVVDTTAMQLIWVQARSFLNGYSVLPTVQVFSLPE